MKLEKLYMSVHRTSDGGHEFIKERDSMDYITYLRAINREDCRATWIAWKNEICGMSVREATRASYNKDWGYTPLAEG